MPSDYDQHTVIAQIAKAVFDCFPPGFYFVVAFTGIILILAANTAFNGFPVLGSILAKDGFLPAGARLARRPAGLQQRHRRSSPVMAIVLIVAFNAETTRLIQLYIVGVFVSFNLSQLGMIRHWTRHLKTEKDPAKRRHMSGRGRSTRFGLAMTAFVFVIVLLTKFLAGAWIAILAMVRLLRDHEARSGATTTTSSASWPPTTRTRSCPTQVHAIVLVSKLHKPTLRALAYAKATRPNVLEAVYVGSDDKATKELVREWDERNLGVPLKVLYSPYREIVRPIIEYATADPQANPRGVVAVYIPEYVVGRWWEQLLHNQTALRLKGRLLFTPGVMVTSVPYQLQSSQIAREREERELTRVKAGDLRRGRVGGEQEPGRRQVPDEPGTSGVRSPGRPGPVAPAAGALRAVPLAWGSASRPRSARSPTAGTASYAMTDRVVFVRHALPGERVVVEVTEGGDGDRFWRGDAVSVLIGVARPGGGALPVRRSRAAAAAATSSTSRPPPSGG